jgi:hypothetical protein
MHLCKVLVKLSSTQGIFTLISQQTHAVVVFPSVNPVGFLSFAGWLSVPGAIHALQEGLQAIFRTLAFR